MSDTLQSGLEIMREDLERTGALAAVEAPELAEILDSVPEAICIYDSDDRIVFWNANYVEMFPWHRDEMFVGRRYEEALRVFFERNLAPDELPNLERHLAAGLARHRELAEPFIFQTRNGKWVTVTPHRLKSGKYMKVWAELTPSMVEVDEYRDLLDTITAIHIGFCFFDTKGRFVFSNKRISEQMPDTVHLYSPGRPFADFIRSCARISLKPETSGALLDIADRPFPADKTFGPLAVETKDGTHLEYEECLTASGALIAVWTDVTDSRLSEMRLRASEAKAQAARAATERLNSELEERIQERTRELARSLDIAEKSDAAKTRLLANVSHELRTPLNAILGFSQMMSGQAPGHLPTEKYQEYSADILSSAEYLLELIDNLLQMSALETKGVLEDIGPTSLPDLFDKTETMLTAMAAKAGVALSFHAPQNIPPVLGSMRGLTQVLLNLGSNALRYTDPGGSLTITAETAPGPLVAIKVRDTGHGMSQDQLANLGDPFSSSHATRTDTKRGAGIGIPLSKLLINAMRGKLTYESAVGKGTTATITLRIPGQDG